MTQSDRPLVLITGSSGLLGQALIDALADEYEIIGLDLNKSGADCTEIECDLMSDESLAGALGQLREKHSGSIAAVIHLAAYYDFTGNEHPLYEKLNVEGTRRLLDGLQNLDVERFVFASSMLVHEPSSVGVPIDESTPIAPAWAYPESKAAAEAAIREYRGPIPCTILRLAGVYSDDGGVPTLTRQIQRIYEQRFKGYLYAGDASRGQSMVHIDDVVEAFRLTVEARNRLPECSAYLIGESQPLSYKAQQNLIADCLRGESGTVLRIPGFIAKAVSWLQLRTEPVVPDAIDQGEKPFIRPFMVKLAGDHYELDTSAARGDLGWRARHQLRDTVPSICDALMRDPIGWYRANGLTVPPRLEQLDKLETGSVQELERQFESSYRDAHSASRWAQFMNLGLASWLVMTPVSHGYTQTALIVSDIAAGTLIAIGALLALSWKLGIARWLQAGVGIYLMAAPLLFWADDAAAYLNDTLIGAVVVGLAVALRPVPGVAPAAELAGPEIPTGWRFSPSSWTQRLPIIALAFVGLLISRYLAAYQLEHIAGVWEPFFPGTTSAQNGTEQIITSSVSRAWPVPDAGLGALTYMLEILTGVIGSRRRWRTMPWLVLLFGFLIVPLGAVSIFFIVIQPIVIGTWCTLCLIAAVAMLLQIPYSLDELVATSQFLKRRYRAGRPLLRVFLFGDRDEPNEADARLPKDEFDRTAGAVIRDCVSGGVNCPWNLAVTMLIGVVLMFSRVLFDIEPPLAHVDHLLGSLIITVAVTALAEVARPVRLFNLLLGAAIVGAPWLLSGGSAATIFVYGVLGLATIGLSLRAGPIENTYGRPREKRTSGLWHASCGPS